jgi:hypothetical protein
MREWRKAFILPIEPNDLRKEIWSKEKGLG